MIGIVVVAGGLITGIVPVTGGGSTPLSGIGRIRPPST